MPTISRFYGIVISMFINDHPPPHFHATYGEHEASVSIHTLDVVNGYLPRHARRLVREWGFAHRAELLDNWRRARARETLKKIEPLS
jgi:hypothetical protein